MLSENPWSGAAVSCEFGELRNNFSCVPDCDLPAVAGAAACSGDALQHGASCNPECDSGYRLEGGALSCALGVLDGSFSCAPEPCEAPEVEHAVACSGAVLQHGEACYPECEELYLHF